MNANGNPSDVKQRKQGRVKWNDLSWHKGCSAGPPTSCPLPLLHVTPLDVKNAGSDNLTSWHQRHSGSGVDDVLPQASDPGQTLEMMESSGCGDWRRDAARHVRRIYYQFDTDSVFFNVCDFSGHKVGVLPRLWCGDRRYGMAWVVGVYRTPYCHSLRGRPVHSKI